MRLADGDQSHHHLNSFSPCGIMLLAEKNTRMSGHQVDRRRGFTGGGGGGGANVAPTRYWCLNVPPIPNYTWKKNKGFPLLQNERTMAGGGGVVCDVNNWKGREAIQVSGNVGLAAIPCNCEKNTLSSRCWVQKRRRRWMATRRPVWRATEASNSSTPSRSMSLGRRLLDGVLQLQFNVRNSQPRYRQDLNKWDGTLEVNGSRL